MKDQSLPDRRRRYFIDKRLQGVWALLNLLIAALVGIFISLEIIRSFFVELGWPLAGKPFNLTDFLFIVRLIILALVGSGFIWILSAFAGHHIAGPVYRLEQSLKEVTKGNYGLRIQFRKKDFFQEIANTFNEMNSSLEKNFSASGLKEKEELIARIKEKIKEFPPDNPQIQELKKLLNL